MKKYNLLLIFLLGHVFIFSQKKSINYFLPDCEYNSAIPTPESVLGYQVGEWHASHDQIVMYLRELARVSPRIVMEEYARSYENRPLYHLYITSESNHSRLGEIQKEHYKLSQPDKSGSVDVSNMPSVVYQGFSIHGNEASGGNAALLVAYHLAAGQCEEVNDILDNVIILLDPVFNPDGFHRFSTWANSHKSKNLSSDPNDREYNEVFPRGRTNHYWFDLNRDWLLLQHPESRGRVAKFQEWKPNILTDHHEMGTNQTFFFMPGIQTRIHPLTPKRNQELTKEIGTYHAAALDKIGSLYFTEERYDDYYYGKGSTYPDANGCVGILFEQASSRGHLQETPNGLMSFSFTIRNQVTTAMSTLRAAVGLREDLLNYQREFYKSAINESRSDSRKGYVFSEPKDMGRLVEFVNLLQKHDINVQTLQQDISAGGKKYKKENSFYVPLQQNQYRLIKSVFDPIFKFDDSLFYDVSTFTLPMAYNIDYQEVTVGKTLSENMPTLGKPEGKVIGGKSEYAYLLEWHDYYAPNALNELLSANLIVKVGTQPFQIPTSEGLKHFDYGTIQIPVSNNQRGNADDIFALIQKVANKNGLTFYGVETGLTPSGSDLGSGDFKPLKKPEVLLLVGSGVNSYDAGEVWHLLDQRYDMAITKMDVSRFSRVDLSRYNCIVMVDGNYNSISSQADKLKDWVQKGGTLIPFKNAIRWAKSKNISSASFKSSATKLEKEKRRPYEKIGADRGSQVIGGAIFQTELDLSHPLGFGYHNSQLPIFRRGTLFLKPAKNIYATPLIYTSSPLLSGYISDKNLNTIKNSASIVVSGLGRGKVINMADNTNFRAFWYGTNKLFANAIFFGHIIDGGTVERGE